MENKRNWTKIGTISLGALLAFSHIGMIGMIGRQRQFPVVNVPVGPYTSYMVEATKEGYFIKYRANDPKVMRVERDIKTKSGFLGLGNDITKITEEYTMDGSIHLDGKSSEQGSGLTSKEIACIEAIGSGKGTGKMVGASVGNAIAPAFSGIPFVGWVLSGAATMIGMNAGSDVGGTMTESLNKNC
tara:strand:+ start:825 stop:1382 length:558 start_codon:yes stop_codon:yes gene_type:complete